MRDTRSEGRPARLLRMAVLVVLLGGLGVLGLTGCAGRSPSHDATLTSASAGSGVLPAGVGPSRSPSPVAMQTVMKQFAPLNANGKLTVAAATYGSGSCFATSIAVPLSGVYRCLSANTILDPCFAPVHEGSPATVACFTDPWSPGRILTLTRALPQYDPDLSVGNPWALELANGVHCISVTGAVPALGDVDLTYQCDNDTVAGLTTDENGGLLAHYGPPSGPLNDVGVSTAWRGRSFRLAG